MKNIKICRRGFAAQLVLLEAFPSVKNPFDRYSVENGKIIFLCVKNVVTVETEQSQHN